MIARRASPAPLALALLFENQKTGMEPAGKRSQVTAGKLKAAVGTSVAVAHWPLTGSDMDHLVVLEQDHSS